jgi:hypothetical protein
VLAGIYCHMDTQPWTTEWSTAVIKLQREPIGPHGQTRLAQLTRKACQLGDARELKEFFRSAARYLPEAAGE